MDIKARYFIPISNLKLPGPLNFQGGPGCDFGALETVFQFSHEVFHSQRIGTSNGVHGGTKRRDDVDGLSAIDDVPVNPIGREELLPQ